MSEFVVFQRKYATLTVTGSTAIRIPILKAGSTDFALSADWTPAAGDVKVSVNGTAAANVTNLPTAVTSGNGAFWEFILTAAELTSKQSLVTIVDAAAKAIVDTAFVVETFGNASALQIADYSATGVPTNVVQWNGSAVGAPATAGTPDVNVKNVGNSTTTATGLVGLFGQVVTGTASAGAASTLTLVSPAVTTANFYLGWTLITTGGTGPGQARLVTAYTVGRQATVSPAWTTTPDATTTFALVPLGQGDVETWRNTQPALLANGQYVSASMDAVSGSTTAQANLADLGAAYRRSSAQAGSATTITLNASASATDDAYKNELINIASGTGIGQTRRIVSYVGSTKVATVDRAWDTNPAAASVYLIFPNANVPDVNTKTLDSALDFTATMKTSLNAATPASVTGAVGSVTGSVTVGTNNDKTGYALSGAGVTAVQSGIATSSALTTAQTDLTTLTGRLTALRAAGLDNLDATVSSRQATFAYTAPDNTGIGNIKTVTDHLATALELNNTLYRFTTAALVNAPSGGGGGSDPWSTLLPAGYALGTGGYILGNLPGTLSSSLAGRSITVVNPVAANNNIILQAGDDYFAADGRALTWTVSGVPSLTGATVTFHIRATSITATVTGPTVTDGVTYWAISVDLPGTTTAVLLGRYDYEVEAVLASASVVTLITGNVDVNADVA